MDRPPLGSERMYFLSDLPKHLSYFSMVMRDTMVNASFEERLYLHFQKVSMVD